MQFCRPPIFRDDGELVPEGEQTGGGPIERLWLAFPIGNDASFADREAVPGGNEDFPGRSGALLTGNETLSQGNEAFPIENENRMGMCNSE